MSHILYVLRGNPATLAGGVICLSFVILALIGPWIVPHDPLSTAAMRSLQPPSATHWFGTDQVGRDIFSRVVIATRLDLGIAVIAAFVSFRLGLLLGAAAGWLGGWAAGRLGGWAAGCTGRCRAPSTR